MIGSNLPFGEQTSACGSVYCWLGLFDNGLCRGGSDGGRGPGGTRCAESVGADAAPSCYGRRFRRWCRRCGRRSRRSRPNIGVAETAVGCGQPSRRTRPDRTAMPINVKTFTSNIKMKSVTDLSAAGVTGSSVDGAVAVARMETKGSSVVDAMMRSILPVFFFL